LSCAIPSDTMLLSAEAYLRVCDPGADRAALGPVVDVLEPLATVACLTLIDPTDEGTLLGITIDYGRAPR
jgi:hypothetical protein